jgi:hypothetical protein
MHRTLVYHLDELWHDHADVAARVSRACAGSEKAWRVRGLAQVADQVFVYLLPDGHGATEEYVLAPWEDESVEGVATGLSERWSAGFDLVGSVRLEAGRYLLLLAKAKPGA